MEADANNGLVRTAQEGGNRGEAGDVFVGTHFLSDNTSPSLRLNSGAASNVALNITVAGGQARIHVLRRPAIPTARMLGPYLGGAALTSDEQASVDAFGNSNGRFDLGDVRRYLRDAPVAQ